MALKGTIPVDRVRLSDSDRNTISNFSFPSDIGPHGLLMIFKQYKYETSRDILNGKEPSVSINSTVMLPLPANLQESIAPRLNQFDQSSIFSEPISIAAAAAKASGNEGMLSAAQNAAKQILPGGGDMAAAITSVFSDNEAAAARFKNVADQANYLLRKSMEQAGVARSFDAGFGTTLNPKTTLGFEGVTFKKHNFQWTLAPRDRQESELVKNITNTIKRNSLPTYQDLTFADNTVVARGMLNYPSTVDMYLIGLDTDYFFHFKTAMIDQVTVNYTPQGLSILKGGRPAAMTLTIDYTETDIHTAEDYQENRQINFN